MSEEKSEHGDPIIRYIPPEGRQLTPADMKGSSIQKIEQHIEAHIGKDESVFHELVSDLVHIDIHIVTPTSERPYYTLVTSGMSDLPMSTPTKESAHRYAELMLCLPANWPMKQDEWRIEENYWPIRWLKYIARFPHVYKTRLWCRHTIPNGDPARPFASNTKMTCMLLANPMTVSTRFWQLKISDEKTIHFFALIPLYPDEIDFKLKKGADELLMRFEKAKHTELINLARKSVAGKSWWDIL
jgi:hypothetical protein